MNILDNGITTVTTKELIHLAKGLDGVSVKFARKDKIEKVKELAMAQHDPETIRKYGDYFKNHGMDEVLTAGKPNRAKGRRA